ncbi:Hypothetical protein R9X50_00375100 [Acrodontium crateriforme]|uniref:Arginine biosynthesis bifunctional protein ArgJ, mitochondrial n=1 Tax=Acrodontium crateriforme TaxID=150365 RepID=A0AAQ3M9M9_9PEZI|nr:Hypothetical protein R9X50_00375100 [Acrodontium crateriforme]
MAPTNSLGRLVAQQVRCYSAPADRAIPAAKQKYVPTSGTYPKGFVVGTSHAGVKASNTKYNDITLIASENLCPGAAVFTRNIFKAAPVTFSTELLNDRKRIRGVIINSGCANAVTGKLGRDHARQMAIKTDACFEHDGEPDNKHMPKTMVMSTGVIGQHLPIDRIKAAIPKAHQALGSTHEHWLSAAKAICTTDTFPKLISRSFKLPSDQETEYSIAGITKGAGMIHPNMATLLGVICTDAKIDKESMKLMLKRGTNKSFNSISIDGDTSTNDTVALLANGAAAPPDSPTLKLPARDFAPKPSDPRHPKNDDNRPNFGDSGKEMAPFTTAEKDAMYFSKVLSEFMVDLAKLVVRDGEGATKFVTIRVQSDKTLQITKQVAASIAQSSLVKTALYGKDANWGRILCAIGYTPSIIGINGAPSERNNKLAQIEPHRTSVSFVPADGSAELKLLVRGEPETINEARAKEILEMEDLEIFVRLDDDGKADHVPGERNGRGRKKTEALFWTCDFSHEYVTINGDYRT